MTIGVFAGCRYLRPGEWWWPTLDALREEHGITVVRHGACARKDKPSELCGGDLLVDQWARDRGLEVQMFPAPWELYRAAGLQPRAAGMRRVADMFAGRRGYVVPHSKHDPDFDPKQAVVTTDVVPGQPSITVCLPGGPGTTGTGAIAKGLGVPVVSVPFIHKPGSPRVINAHHHVIPGMHGRRPPLPEPWRYIGRTRPLGPSPLANPYTKTEHGLDALHLYRRWLWSKICANDAAVVGALQAITADEHLVCHCKRVNGSGPCHGDIVVLAWEWLRRSHWAACLPSGILPPTDGVLLPRHLPQPVEMDRAQRPSGQPLRWS